MKATPGRIVVELDDLASRKLREAMQGRGEGIPTGPHDPRDLVSAAVTFMLCGEDGTHGKFDLSDSWDCVKRAAVDRQRLERKADR